MRMRRNMIDSVLENVTNQTRLESEIATLYCDLIMDGMSHDQAVKTIEKMNYTITQELDRIRG